METPIVGKDFYLRSPNDPNYKEGVYESNDSTENALQQIRMTLLTRPGEVLGEDIGFNAERYLFEFELSDVTPMERDANDQINEYVLFTKPYTISATAFTLDDIGDPYKVGLGLNIKIDGVSAFATLFDM